MLSTVLAAGAGVEPRAMRALSAKTDAKPKAVVHVGPHKMGSTSLQELIFLPENINILNQDKYEVPAHIGSTSYPPKAGADIAECYQGSPCSDPSCPSYLRNSTDFSGESDRYAVWPCRRHLTDSRAKLPRLEGTSCSLPSISTLPMTLLGWPRHWTPSTQQLPCHIARFSIGCHQSTTKWQRTKVAPAQLRSGPWSRSWRRQRPISRATSTGRSTRCLSTTATRRRSATLWCSIRWALRTRASPSSAMSPTLRTCALTSVNGHFRT